MVGATITRNSREAEKQFGGFNLLGQSHQINFIDFDSPSSVVWNQSNRIEMKIVQSALSDLAVLGLGPNQLATQQYPINRRNVQTLIIFYFESSLCFAYMLFEANTFQEFAVSVYASATFLLGAVVYSIAVWKHGALCGLLALVEKTIDGSKRISHFQPMCMLTKLSHYFQDWNVQHRR